MKSKKTQHIVQLITVIASVILVNYIVSFFFVRLDLTSDKRFTLKEETKEILEDLDDIVYIRVYLDGQMPIGFQRMRESMLETLDEFRVYAGSNLQFEFVNPSDEDTETRDKMYQDLYERGLEPTNVQQKDAEGGLAERVLFPGAIISYQGRGLPVNVLRNNPSYSAEQNLNTSIQSLEYKFIQAIYQLTLRRKPAIAFIEGNGELDEYETADITETLAPYYQQHRVSLMGDDTLLLDYDLVIVAGPTEPWSEADKFALDQYIMRGGNVLWAMEKVMVNNDSLATRGNSFALMNDANLTDQLFTYGVRVNPEVVKDMQCAVIPVNTAPAGQQAKFSPAPWLYHPLITPPEGHEITRDLNVIRLKYPAHIDVLQAATGHASKVLLRSSPTAVALQAPVLVDLQEVRDQIDPRKYRQGPYNLAVLLEGSFSSVFRNRPVEGYIDSPDFEYLAESKKEGKMAVLSDADFLRNEVDVRADGIQMRPLGYDRYSRQTYGNKEFMVNLTHYLASNAGLLKIRERDIKLRLLDKQKIRQERLKWQIINTVLPAVLIILLGVAFAFSRKQRYAK
ncbi:MAG: gliding motility-associated ABC transporter substrate-binding protein GldG [Bacteroidota bacterium]